MKKKVSDYIAEYITGWGVKHVFTVTGGGAMHLNDAFGHCPGLKCIYNHHEQASAMAAEAYARVNNEMAAVCVTSGPGATNAITGVLCGWMDSIPMLVISGQVRYDTTVQSTGLRLRSMGVQEYNIVQSVAPMTKYAVMVTDPLAVGYHLERALYLAKHGRPGPVWLDIPLNVQGAVIETEDLIPYDPREDEGELPPEVPWETADRILEKLKGASRPVIFVGNGVRLSGAMDAFRELAECLGVPVVTGMSSVDAMETAHPLYTGRSGGTGDRAGNFAVQNSDVLLSLGSRQSFVQTGFQYKSWARCAYTILNDIDEEELKKPNLHVDLPVCGDAADLIQKLLKRVKERGASQRQPWFGGEDWRFQCLKWKETYPVVTGAHYREMEKGCTNIYAFYHELTGLLEENSQMVVSVGTARVAGSQASVIKKGQRFITNPNTASMGYGLPASIGVSLASGREAVCVTGEGSMQMNLQELQTIIHNRLPIRLFVINNQGYHSIRQTQSNYFKGPLVGVGEESKDLSFPDVRKLAGAYGYEYASCRSGETLREDLKAALGMKPPCICEVFVTKYQKTEPKTASRQLSDGTMVSATLEDMYPFLEREELRENMYIPLEEEGK